jgi:hypothetical protein
VPNATWLTFRRTYASWAHDKGVPGKVVAQLMGHTNADVTLNVYTQVLDASLRTAVDRIGGELFTIVHKPERRQRKFIEVFEFPNEFGSPHWTISATGSSGRQREFREINQGRLGLRAFRDRADGSTSNPTC